MSEPVRLLIHTQDGHGEGRLYVTGLVERRFRSVCWVMTEGEGPEATARRREMVKHLEAAGVRVEGLVPGWIGAAVPVGMSDAAFAQLKASAPYPIREESDGDTRARA